MSESKTAPLPLRRWFWLQALVLLTAAVLALPALAERNDRDDRDPPTRVARVSDVQGEVWWFDPDARDWQPLVRNQTLAEGDRLRVGGGGRVGLRVGVHGFWLDERSELDIRRLDEDRIELELEQGSLALRLATREAAYETRVRTQDGRFSFERAGAYRVDQMPRASRTAVYEGKLRFERRGEDVPPVYVDEGEQAEFWWDGGPRAERGRLNHRNGSRDRFGSFLTAQLGFGDRGYASWEGRPASRYVSPELTGADELDAYGRWERHDEYGPLWVPLRVAVDWAPYRYGRWTWTRHWGWTWVDDNPWGYATSHYGRWVHVGSRWCWTPGVRIVTRPVFAPALVAWVGSGNVSVGVTIGGRTAPPVAWVPLSPWEQYRPWYRHSPRYVARFEPDPVTVRRPVPSSGPSWRNVPGAVSTLQAGAGAQGRPMPLRDEAVLRQMQPLPQGPSREVAVQSGLPVRGGFAPPTSQAPQARGNDDEQPRVRAGGSGGFALPTREGMPEQRREAMPEARREPMPEVRRESMPERRDVPWRQEVPQRMEQPEPQRQEQRQEWRRAPAFEPPEREQRRSREESMPMRAPQQVAPPMPMPAPQIRPAEPPRRFEMPTRQESRPEPRQEQRAEPRRGRDDEERGPRRPDQR